MANLKEIVCTPENPFGVEREMSDADQKLYDDLQKQFDDNKSERQLAKIRQLRNQKLIETDFFLIVFVVTTTQHSVKQILQVI